MNKVTRIAYSRNLNLGKYNQLNLIAKRFGKLRKEVWHRYGSISGVGLTHRQIRDGWLAERRNEDIPARLWKETLRDTFSDICLYREAAKVKVRSAIAKRTYDSAERKRLFTLLKYDRWTEDSYQGESGCTTAFIRRMMRKYYKHGKTKVENQIVLDTGCYTAFERNGQAWIKVMGIFRGKRIAIPLGERAVALPRLDTNRLPEGTLRLIIRNGRVEVHYTVSSLECSKMPCGEKEIGIDKGYSEVFTDSEGKIHGEDFGNLLSFESDYLKIKYQRRNKLKAITEVKPHKCKNTLKNNLGRQKLERRKQKHHLRVRDKVFKAVHSVVEKAKFIVCEDLSAQFQSKKRLKKDQKRRLSGWVKGLINEALTSVSQRRGSSLFFVNCAYRKPLASVSLANISQMDSRYGVLLGHRNGEKFYFVCPFDRTFGMGCQTDKTLFRQGLWLRAVTS